jgi:hypothetical protein
LNSFQESGYPSPIADFILASQIKPVTDPNYDTVFHCPSTSVVLLERRQKLHNRIVATNMKMGTMVTEEAYTGFPCPLDPVQQFPALVEVEFTLSAKVSPCNSWLVCRLRNEAGDDLMTEHVELRTQRSDYSSGQKICKRFYFETQPESEAYLDVYIWNIERNRLTVKDVRVTLYCLLER